MALNRIYNLGHRRKRLSLTNYRTRLKLLLSKKTRIVIRKSLNEMTVQLVNYNREGDKILKSFNSRILKIYNWKYHPGNIPSAYLLGLIVGLESEKINVKEAILDIGLKQSIKGSALYAALKGVLDGGLKIPHDKNILPEEDRIKGKHIFDYYAKLSQDKKIKQFSKYLKNNVNPSNIMKDFEETRLKIISEYKND